MVYWCKGSDTERLDWFETINLAGAKLTDQEMRNAVYEGPWTAEAKRWFSRLGCPAYMIGKHFVSGSVNRQEYLEVALDWVSDGEINVYMAKHQKKEDINPMRLHYESVINWANATFVENNSDIRKELKSVNWGDLYRRFGKKKLSVKEIRNRVKELMRDDDVQKKSGIYEYVLSGSEKHLNIRAFRNDDKRNTYEKQDGICANKNCGKVCDTINEMEADHITPWSEGGKTILDNCQMLCKDCNRRKGAR